jgi:hypothetical protein
MSERQQGDVAGLATEAPTMITSLSKCKADSVDMQQLRMPEKTTKTHPQNAMDDPKQRQGRKKTGRKRTEKNEHSWWAMQSLQLLLGW